MNTKDFNKLVESCKETAVGIASKEQCMSMCMVVRGNEVNIMSVPLYNDIDKMVFKPAMEAFFKLVKAEAYILIGEAWVSKLSSSSPLLDKLLKGQKRVSDLPLDDRGESLMLIVVVNNKSIVMWSAGIKYDRDNNRIIGEWEYSDRVGDGKMIIRSW